MGQKYKKVCFIKKMAHVFFVILQPHLGKTPACLKIKVSNYRFGMVNHYGQKG